MSAWLRAQLREAELHVAELRRQLGEDEPERAISMREIVRAVAETFGIDEREILGRRRTAPFNRPRQAAMGLIRDLTGKSYPAIGQLLGRDHTTIVDGYRVHARRMGIDAEYAASVRAVSERFQRGLNHVEG